MEAKELREKSVEDLAAELKKLKESLFKAKFTKASGQFKKLSDLRAKRRDVARILTVLGEKGNK